MKRKLQLIDKITILYIVTAILILITVLIGIVTATKMTKSDVQIEDEPQIITPISSTTEIEYRYVISHEPEIPEPTAKEWVVSVSEQEVEEMARVVMNEASILPYTGKVLVAHVMVNRLKDGRWGDTMHDVLYYDNAFSHADCNGDVTEDCRAAVLEALEYGDAFPNDLLYFRVDHPHSFGYQYAVVGNTYFSTEIDYEGGDY